MTDIQNTDAINLQDQETSPPLPVETGIAFPKRFGLTILLLVFGGFGAWSAIVPIDEAAHAAGVVTVKSNKKLIQHLEGGIVSELLARDGDFIRAGEPILILDNTQSLAQLEIANAQLVSLTALEARLTTERVGLEAITYPPLLFEEETDGQVEMTAQSQIFDTRKAAIEGSVEVLEQRIEQLQSGIVGLEAVKLSKEELAASYSEELEDTRALLDQGFSDKTRLRELERNYATFNGEAAELTANISSTEIQVGEARLEILQLEREFQNSVAEELGEVQTNLKDIRERIIALRDVVSRTNIRAPEDGVLTGMQAHTVGGVITPGQPIAELVPQSDELIIEANLSTIDIDRVAIDQEATIRFSSFGRTAVPTIFGTVISVSADSMVDEYTGTPYYLARIEVSPEGIADLGDLVLVPGMPAEAFINTGSRTLLQYLINPITNSMARMFRED